MPDFDDNNKEHYHILHHLKDDFNQFQVKSLNFVGWRWRYFYQPLMVGWLARLVDVGTGCSGSLLRTNILIMNLTRQQQCHKIFDKIAQGQSKEFQ